MTPSDASWWERKLGNGTGGQRPSTPDTWNLQRHAAPTPAYAPPPPSNVPYSDAPVLDENGQMHVGDAITRWRGGEGTKEETLRCPQCGSVNFFSRRQNAVVTQNGMAWPAPTCADCSYNGLFKTFGGD